MGRQHHPYFTRIANTVARNQDFSSFQNSSQPGLPLFVQCRRLLEKFHYYYYFLTLGTYDPEGG